MYQALEVTGVREEISHWVKQRMKWENQSSEVEKTALTVPSH